MSNHFENDVITKWLTGPGEDRDMELIECFAFVEPAQRWEAPPGSVVNGASIPSGLWSIVGSPFVGNYRRAAVLHDVYYGDHQGKTRKRVDEMFRSAMLTDGVSDDKAQLMYAGVRVGGAAAWDAPDPLRPKKSGAQIDWTEFEVWFETEAVGLSDEALDDAIERRYGPIE
jgi:hypothetical protein